MITVVIALIPCVLMAMYNTGLQANIALEAGAHGPDGWRAWLLEALGAAYDHESVFDCVAHGAVYYLPVLLVTFVVGLLWEVLFAVVRRHEVTEGFFVTGMLFPLILPATIPLWQVALGISFGVVFGKEVFGGTGYNVFNPALVARAFLFFGYPGQISGDRVWVAADGFSGATLLAQAQQAGMTPLAEGSRFWDAFLGTIPGSMGETSTLAILLGAAVLIVTGVGSWRIMLAVALGGAGAASLLNLIGSATNPMFDVPFWWHFVIGGMAFAAVFMATDPVTAPFTRTAQWIYGALIGALIIVVRVLNPAYPDGLLVAILLMNVFAPLLDHYVVRAHVRRRRARHAG
jgi:Na+-transporting NADH:ubiquinone oxidoreductase subunit B